MRAVYGLNMQTMEHTLICDGIGAKFNMQGKYIGSNVVVHKSLLPADVISLLQQGTLCELAVITGDRFAKKQMDLTTAKMFLDSITVPCKATFQIKRKVGQENCIQYIYVYPMDKILPLLRNVF